MREVGAYFLDIRYPTRERWAEEHEPFSDEYLEERISQMGNGTYHHPGTCKMGARGDATAVVDPQLRYWYFM